MRFDGVDWSANECLHIWQHAKLNVIRCRVGLWGNVVAAPRQEIWMHSPNCSGPVAYFAIFSTLANDVCAPRTSKLVTTLHRHACLCVIQWWYTSSDCILQHLPPQTLENRSHTNICGNSLYLMTSDQGSESVGTNVYVSCISVTVFYYTKFTKNNEFTVEYMLNNW